MDKLEREMRDFKNECRQEALEELHEAKRLASDYDYALESSGIEELYSLVNTVKNNMHKHGWDETTTKEILEYIDESQ